MQKEKVLIGNGQLENILAVTFAPVVALTELIKNSSDACTIPNDTIKVYIETESNTIRLIDNGDGFCLEDIKNLHTIGFSTKMRGDNTLSRIGEPFAGSKGLGILTAFNLCNQLEILTFSQKDKKSYRVLWVKGTSEMAWEEIPQRAFGTELILHNVTEETFKLLLMNEELIKLYLSSVKCYVESKSLPKIELYNSGVLNNLTPKAKIDDLYNKFKVASKTKGYFVAKASFKYSNNKLVISYEDNEKHIFNFQNEEIDLLDFTSISEFKKNIKYLA